VVLDRSADGIVMHPESAMLPRNLQHEVVHVTVFVQKEHLSFERMEKQFITSGMKRGWMVSMGCYLSVPFCWQDIGV
jgi:hypothetical protein